MTASHAGIYGGESELASYSRFCASVYAREANMKDYDGEDDEDDVNRFDFDVEDDLDDVNRFDARRPMVISCCVLI